MKYIPRKLAERSHLVFQFPQEQNRFIEAYLPILEKLEISESRKANLSSYDLIGRNGSLYSHLGAKSRTFSLRFNITLNNVIDYFTIEGILDIFKFNVNETFGDSKMDAMQRFFDLKQKSEKLTSRGLDHAKIQSSFYKDLTGVQDPKALFSFLTPPDNSSEKNKIINLIMFWVNLVRASVLNNATNSSLGPPIVRLNHGVMYNNIPCVVENISVRPMTELGYDVKTMLPRVIEVSLSMNETRVGNFGEFKAQKIIDGDNNVGWEAVLDTNNMDPYNGLIGLKGSYDDYETATKKAEEERQRQAVSMAASKTSYRGVTTVDFS